MKYLPLVITLLCLTAQSSVESVQKLLEQNNDQYHIEQQIDTHQPMYENEFDIKKEKEVNTLFQTIEKHDTIEQSVLLDEQRKPNYNLLNVTHPNTKQDYTSNSSSIKKIDKYIPSRLKLKIRNNQNLGQGQIKNNTQKVVYYNPQNGTYENVVIYNNNKVKQNYTDSYYYYYDKDIQINLEKDYDDYGNVVYRNFKYNYSLVINSNSSDIAYNSIQEAFGTLVLNNNIFSGQYNKQVVDNGGIQYNWNDYIAYNKNNSFNGQAQYSNKQGNYSYDRIDYGGSNLNQQSNYDRDRQNYFRGDYDQVNGSMNLNYDNFQRNENKSSELNLGSQSEIQIEGDNLFISKNGNEYISVQRNQSSSYFRQQDSFSNNQSAEATYQQNGYYNNRISGDQYSISNYNTQYNYLDTQYGNYSENYYDNQNKNQTSFDYNLTVNNQNTNSIQNSTNSIGIENISSINLIGNEQKDTNIYYDQIYSQISGQIDTQINNTNAKFDSEPKTTVYNITEQDSIGTMNHYKNDNDEFEFQGVIQTNQTQSVTEQQRQQFNQLRGSKKQVSGSWTQIEVAEIQQFNSIIIEQAIDEINTKFNPQQFGYYFDSILNVQEQIVSGINYKIQLSYTNLEFQQQIYQVIIYSIPWQNQSNQVVKSIRFDQFEN
ncbi:unnamed protein product [Paramecium pentaurelia]|uniref:Cystatin domain-containing protein n=1 Tax=Paramecium pentaurelia TaxID=43138 RepID=A0A8S1Y081_9CILI|nr:unnamed protein product [Paramecium pentaurelia]